MRTFAGPDSQVHFTHLSRASSDSLSIAFAQSDTDSAAAASGKAKAVCHSAGVLELMKDRGVPLSKVCLLDPKAEKALSPEDGDGEFEWFLFGVRTVFIYPFWNRLSDRLVQGILGDDPPRDRTSELRVLGFPNRHLGPVQMTTDTALGVTKLVVQDKKRLDEIPYVVSTTIFR
jgi:ribosome biogenesis SPOUT family RNA methylase Rps3